MYQPELNQKSLRAIYRIGRAKGSPMTKVLGEMVRQSVEQLNKEEICRQCVAEGNQDCGNCLLGELETVKEQKA